MKIICFLFDPNVGGPTIRARAVYEILTSPSQTDPLQVQVVFPRNDGPALSYIQDAGLPARRLQVDKPVLPRKLAPFLRFAASSPVALWRLWRFLRRERPDVIHVNGAFDVLPAIAGRLAGVAVVWHLNDTIFGSRLSQILGWFVNLTADVVIVAAERVGQHYGIPQDRWTVVHAPVDVGRFPARDLSSLPSASPRLTLIGNWNWIKGQDRFVDVITGLRSENLRVTGQIIGRFLDGQEDFWKPICDRIRVENLTDVIDTPGFIADTPGILANTDLLLLTSHSEASPIAVLEAMAVGVPVVAFDVGGVREQLGVPSGDGSQHSGAAGIVVPAGDVNAMIDACRTVLSNSTLWHRLARNGQRRARDHFSLETCAARHVKAYEKALSSHSGRPNRNSRKIGQL